MTRLTVKAVNYGVARNASAPSNVAHVLAAQSATEACQISGTVTMTLDDKDGSLSLTAGDTLAMSFVQCSDAPNSSINGAMTFSFSKIATTPNTVDLAGSIAFQQLMMTDQAASFLMNGGFAFTISEAPVTNGIRDLGSYTVASTGLTVATSGGAAGYSDTFTYRAGYTVTEEDFSPNVAGLSGTYVVTANGNFRSSALDGDLSLATTQPFRLTDPDENPTEGQLTVNGMNNTKLAVTAVTNSQVRIDVCDDGDGVWEGTKTVDWSSLIQ